MEKEGSARDGVRAVVVPVNGKPYETTLTRGEGGSILPALQGAVGGLVDLYGPLAEDLAGADVWFNDEGIYECPPNRAVWATEAMGRVGYANFDATGPAKKDELMTILFGNLVVTGHDAEGNTVSLNQEQVDAATRYFTKVSYAGSGMDAVAAIREGRDTTRRPTLEEEAAAMKAACEAPENAGTKPGGGFDDVDAPGGMGRVRTLSLAEQARQARESCERGDAGNRDAGPTLYRGDER